MINENGNLVIEAGKVFCHGTFILLKTKLSNGDLWFRARPNRLCQLRRRVRRCQGRPEDPVFPDRGGARKIEGANCVVDAMSQPYAVRDGNLITGLQ